MLYTIITAFSIAILIVFTPGAALFSLLKTSVSRGFKAGFWQAIGISLSDILIVVFCLCGLGRIMEDNLTVRLITSIIGGIILIIYGGHSFFNKNTDLNPAHNENLVKRLKSKTQVYNPYEYVATGFTFNFTNPFVWILWLGIIPYSGITLRQQTLFFLITLGIIFGFDLCKCFFAHKIKTYLTPEKIFLASRISGLLIGILGFGLIIKTLTVIL